MDLFLGVIKYKISQTLHWTGYGHFLVLEIKAYVWIADVRLDKNVLNFLMKAWFHSTRLAESGMQGSACLSSIGIRLSSLQSPKLKRRIFLSRFHSSLRLRKCI